MSLLFSIPAISVPLGSFGTSTTASAPSKASSKIELDVWCIGDMQGKNVGSEYHHNSAGDMKADLSCDQTFAAPTLRRRSSFAGSVDVSSYIHASKDVSRTPKGGERLEGDYRYKSRQQQSASVGSEIREDGNKE